MKLMVEVTKRYNEHHRETVVIQVSKENDLFFNFTYQVDSREFDKYVKQVLRIVKRLNLERICYI